MAVKTRHPVAIARESAAASQLDLAVRDVLDSALIRLRNAAFAIESCAHLRGLERTLLPISDPLRQQIAALEAVLDPPARDPNGDRARADADQP